MERGLGADLIRDEVSKGHRLSGPSDRVREKATRAWFAGWEKLEREKPWLLRPPVSDVPSGGDEALARAMWMKEQERKRQPRPGILERLYGAVERGVSKGWGKNDPIGLDPATRQELRQYGGAFYGPAGVINEAVSVPFMEVGDIAVRGGHAAARGGAALTGQIIEELGAGSARQIERELMALPEAFAGALGRAVGIARHLEAGNTVRTTARHHVPTQLDRLIARGGKPVKVGEISEDQLEAIRMVVTQSAYRDFRQADKSVYATAELLKSLRIERPKHAERLIRGMPDHLKEGEIRANRHDDRMHRPIFLRPGVREDNGKKSYDVMVLDATEKPGAIGVPTLHTARPNIFDGKKKP